MRRSANGARTLHSGAPTPAQFEEMLDERAHPRCRSASDGTGLSRAPSRCARSFPGTGGQSPLKLLRPRVPPRRFGRRYEHPGARQTGRNSLVSIAGEGASACEPRQSPLISSRNARFMRSASRHEGTPGRDPHVSRERAAHVNRTMRIFEHCIAYRGIR